MKKSVSAVALAFALLCPMASAIENSKVPVDIMFNSFTIDLDNSAWVEDGVTMIPVEEFCRAVFGNAEPARYGGEALPDTVLVRWAEDGSNGLSIQRGDLTLFMELGSNLLKSSNGEKLQMAANLELVDGIAYAPLRPVAESLGLKAEWIDNTVVLSKRKTQVKVDSLESFFNALTNDTEIVVAAGTYDFSTLDIAHLNNPYVAVDYEVFNTETGEWSSGDRWQIVVQNIHDLSIMAEDVTFSTPWAYADVLSFDSCRRVTVSGPTAVHDVEPGYCTGNCLELTDCIDFQWYDGVLNGSGAYGLYATGCQNVGLENTEISHCTYGAVALDSCRNTAVKQCAVRNCINCFDLLTVNGCVGVHVENCLMEGNSASTLVTSDGGWGVKLENCTFKSNVFKAVNAYAWNTGGGAALVNCNWEA